MTQHPATFTDALLPIMAELLLQSHGHTVAMRPGPAKILDPFAGTGKIARLRQWLPPPGDLMSPGGPQAEFFGYEIESEWADLARTAGCLCTTGDSRHMHYPDAMFDAICTSPTYGNRMADHHEARDGSPRHTYRHVLGRPLTPGNSGAMQWGDGIAGRSGAGEEYRALHVAVWTECRRVLKPGGIFVLNVKDHIRKGVLQPVTNWHAVTLLMLGFVCIRRVHVPCPGQRHGANGHLRVAYESVLQLRLATPEATSERPASFNPSVVPTTGAESSGSEALRSAYPRRGLSLCERVSPVVF